MVRLLAAARRLVLLTHARPDGDGLGSLIGLHLAAAAAGKTSHIFLLDPVPRRYEFLLPAAGPAALALAGAVRAPGGTAFQAVQAQVGKPVPPDIAATPQAVAALADGFAALAEPADMVLIVDTGAFSQLEPLRAPLRAARAKLAVLDHHITGDDLCDCAWIDPTAAAAGVMALELIEQLGWPLELSAEPLLAAILTDTGFFRFSNTDARALRAAARLVELGARPERIFEAVHQNDRPQRLRLLSAALGSLRFEAGGRLGVMSLTRDDFARTGAADEEAEDFVNEPLRVGGVEVSLLLSVRPDGKTRGSLRSRPGPGAVDVARIAAHFGGGGHARAAGFRTDLPPEAVIQAVAQLVQTH